MTRAEFIDTLQKTLTGRISSSSVNENIRYYQEYIDTQVRAGRSEEEVIAELGNPRLLARTIIEADKREGQTAYGEAQEYDEVYEDGTQAGAESGRGGAKVYRMPGWLITVLVVLVMVLIIGVIGSVLSMLLPFIIPIMGIILIVRLVNRRE